MAYMHSRSGNLVLFTDESRKRGVIVDSEYSLVVASGQFAAMKTFADWSEGGEYSETDQALADTAFSSMDSIIAEPTGRMYTVPRGVQQEAKKALTWLDEHERGGTEVSYSTASVLASGGQVNFEKLRHIGQYFSRHENDKFTAAWEPAKDGGPSAARITWGMWGGDTGQKWASSILNRESEKALTADAVLTNPPISGDPFLEAYTLDPEGGPEFLARVRLDGSGIDRLYKIDLDREVYVWDDGVWDNIGLVDADLWSIDAALDMPDGEIVDQVGKTHLVIDPDSAVIIAHYLGQNPFKPVSIEDIDQEESRLAVDAIPDGDWTLVDSTLAKIEPVKPVTAAVGDGIDTPEERADRASAQVRDSNGKFASQGQRVVVGGDPTQVGTITQVNSADGSVNVQLEKGGNVKVSAKQVGGIDSFTATIPGKPVNVPRVDVTGILAQPRTPINVKGAQIPGTLPAMTTKDMHDLLYNWPAWVKGQRDAFKAPTGMAPISVGTRKNSDTSRPGNLEKETGYTLLTDAYDHPLLNRWLNKTDQNGAKPNTLWYQPNFSITAAAEGDTDAVPGNSDVQPVYMAVVASDDPLAVTSLISIVPAGPNSTAPMVYARQDGKWEKDEKMLADLKSATPPPVVPLNSEILQDCLAQVDQTQEEQPADDAPTDTVQVAADPVEVTGEQAVATATGVTASVSLDEALMVLFGPTEELLAVGLTAAGGLDRNRGGAEKLRRYWTRGLGGAKIRWNTGGDWTRCVRFLGKYLGNRSKGYCSLRHKEMTGMWPGDRANREMASLNDQTFSDQEIVTEEEFINFATLPVRAQMARDRRAGLTASSYVVNPDTIRKDSDYRVPPVSGGSPFVIPLLLPIGVEAGDGRIIMPDAKVMVRTLPIPLLWQINTASGHDGSVIVGRIDSVEITPLGVKNAVGVFDTGTYGREAERMVREGFLRGVSPDMDLFEASEATTFSDEDDEKISTKRRLEVSTTRVMAATLVAKPAFQEVQIFLTGDEFSTPEEEYPMIPDGLYTDDADPIEAAAIVAAGYMAEHIPVAPPSSWFSNPNLNAPTPITVTDDGRVFGHIASWNTDHIGMAGNTRPPRSRSNYAYFQTGALRTEEGTDVEVGQLTLAGGHADLSFSARETVRHYDDTASAVADVKAGEDAHGIWVSGGLRPGTTPEQIRALRASAPSGDWRPIKGRLELVAVCQVNVPGFPVARTLVAGGQPMALVAAGAATIARLKSDPISEMTARLEKLEQFTTAELSTKVDPIRTKFAAIKAEREAVRAVELSAKAEALAARVAELSNGSYVPSKQRSAEPVIASSDLRSRLAEFAAPSTTKQAKKELEDDAERLARQVDPTGAVGKKSTTTEQGTQTTGNPESGADADPKFTPKTQPRNSDGKFRLILARLQSNVSVNGNQDLINKIKQAQDLSGGRDYKQASLSYADLSNTIDRIDTKSLDAKTTGTMKLASRNLAEVVANMPLPFDDQSQKIRASDMPPVLRQMTLNLMLKVRQAYGTERAAEKLSKATQFMSGGDYYSQSDISSMLNSMVHSLTQKEGK